MGSGVDASDLDEAMYRLRAKSLYFFHCIVQRLARPSFCILLTPPSLSKLEALEPGLVPLPVLPPSLHSLFPSLPPPPPLVSTIPSS